MQQDFSLRQYFDILPILKVFSGFHISSKAILKSNKKNINIQVQMNSKSLAQGQSNIKVLLKHKFNGQVRSINYIK